MGFRKTTVSIVDALVNDIEQRIFAGDVTAGTPFTETQVASRYEVARPTAKAAIEKLVAEGLLSRDAHKTAKVPTILAKDVQEIYDTRTLMESGAIRKLAAHKAVPPQAIEANRHIEFAISHDNPNIIDHDIAFHSALIDALGNERYSKLYQSIWSEIRLCMAQVQGRTLLSNANILAEHERILQAIREGDAIAGVSEIEQHLAAARDRLAGKLQQNSDPDTK